MAAAKKLKSINRPDIFEYNDYRTFLKVYFDYCAVKDKKFSMRKLSMQMGLSPGYFYSVLANRISFRVSTLEDLGKYTDLNSQELNFLRYLVTFCDAKNLQEQQEAFAKLNKFKVYKTKNLKNLAAHQYISSWHYFAILELMRQQDFELKPQWIQRNLIKNVSLSEIRDALNFLFQYGFVELDDTGKVIITDMFLKCDGELFKLALTQHYRQTFDIALDSIYLVPREERHLASHTVSMTAKEFQEAKKIIDKAHHDLERVTSGKSDGTERVYHIGLHSFPLSIKKGAK